MKKLSLQFFLGFCFLLAALPSQAIVVLIKAGSTATAIPFLLVDSGTGQTGLTGKSANIVITVYKPGGSGYVASAGTLTERGNGTYDYAPTSTEDASTGILYIHITDTTDAAQVIDSSAQVVAFDPNDATRLGITALPNVNAGGTGGLPTATNSSGQVVAASVAGNVSGSVASVTGAVGSVTGSVASVTGSVGSVTGSVASVTGAVGSVTGNVGGNLVGNVNGNVAGSVGSVTAAVNLPTTPPTGYGGSGGGGGATAAAVAAAILKTPANLLATDANGYVLLTAGEHKEIAADTVDGGNTTLGTPTGGSPNAILQTLNGTVGTLNVNSDGSINVGGYSSGQDPGTYFTTVANVAVPSTPAANSLFAILQSANTILTNLTTGTGANTKLTDTAFANMWAHNVAPPGGTPASYVNIFDESWLVGLGPGSSTRTGTAPAYIQTNNYTWPGLSAPSMTTVVPRDSNGNPTGRSITPGVLPLPQ